TAPPMSSMSTCAGCARKSMTLSSGSLSIPCGALAMSSMTPPDPPRRRSGAPSWSLAGRLTAWYTGAAFVLILGATLFLYETLVSSLEREDDEFLQEKVRVFQVLLRERPGDTAALAHEVEWESVDRPSGQVYVRVLGPDGAALAETPSLAQVLPPD